MTVNSNSLSYYKSPAFVIVNRELNVHQILRFRYGACYQETLVHYKCGSTRRMCSSKNIEMSRYRVGTENREEHKRRSAWRRLVDMAIPLQAAVLMALGLLYLMSPDDISNLSLTITPELRYVRGPPPT